MRPQPGAGFDWIDRPAGPALVCRALEPFAAHLFTTRPWALGVQSTDPAARRDGWRQLAEEMSVDEMHLSRLHQVHGAAVVVRRPGESAPAEPLPAADIIINTDPAVAVAVQTADCVPILLVDPESGAVAAAHAGWRGLAARVPAAAVRGLVETAGASPDSLLAAIGPAISAARYEVGADVRARFESGGFTPEQIARWFPAPTRAGHWLFDGWESARAQLHDAGVPAHRISVAGVCTATFPDLFCSYRRDGAPSGRMAAAIRSRPR